MHCTRRLALTSLLTLALTALAQARGTAPLTLADLGRLDADQLESLFRLGRIEGIPQGAARGRVLRLGERLPRLRGSIAGAAWRGKHFTPEGAVNQWPGFRAISTDLVSLGPSWLDGLPCLAIEYPAGTPIFGNARDELREIAPGLYLGRLYDRCPHPRLRGYFAIQFECACPGR